MQEEPRGNQLAHTGRGQGPQWNISSMFGTESSMEHNCKVRARYTKVCGKESSDPIQQVDFGGKRAGAHWKGPGTPTEHSFDVWKTKASCSTNVKLGKDILRCVGKCRWILFKKSILGETINTLVLGLLGIK